MPNTPYLREIDGLRAIAVLIIVFFHLQITGFGGGFIGVDVFFVVSGFLITKIIFSNLQQGRFTFRDFYLRRIARIIPALAVTVAVVLLCAMYLQLPKELEHTALQSITALLSVSNFFSGPNPTIGRPRLKPSPCCIPGPWAWKSSFTWCTHCCCSRPFAWAVRAVC